MYTKSIIQQTRENFLAKDSLRSGIENLMEKYTIEDSVFVLKNGFIHEATQGYFAVVSDYDDLAKAVSECDLNTMGIRVIKDRFQTGKLYRKISEAREDDKLFDLSRLEDVQ